MHVSADGEVVQHRQMGCSYTLLTALSVRTFYNTRKTGYSSPSSSGILL